MRTSARLRRLPPYLFAEIDRQKRAARDAGRDIIDFGVGDPDLPTPEYIVARLRAAAGRPENQRYPQGTGSRSFRRAMATFLQRRYGVTVDPEQQVLALIGSKEGIGHLPLALLDPGDVALIPCPAYPVYRSGTIFAGAEPFTLELREDRGFLPDLKGIPADVLQRARLLFINYPNNPTGATAPLSFYEEAVAFARQHDLIVAQDAAYNDMYFGDHAPHSILEIPGAAEVAVEFHSASKSFNMTGWRIGFAAGRADVLAALAAIKANLDSGAFTAVQEAAEEAYTQYDHAEIVQLREVYRARVATLCGPLREMGFGVRIPQATFYVWARVPAGLDSMTVCRRLLAEADVVCVPGVGFGAAGEGYVRFALSVSAERIAEAVRRMGAIRW